MKFLSVCSGIEAASVAWGTLGWKAAYVAEIEPFPSALLAHHYPDVPNLGDMTKIPQMLADGDIEPPDILCGGTPCQAFSVAGLRNSLDDARGNLSLVFCEIANELGAARSLQGLAPAVIFWENVPGVLNTKDNAFGCFLAGLAGEDDPVTCPDGKWSTAGVVVGAKRAVAWRVLDAQYFGVAQRRRRVFVVASARDGFDPSRVLFEFDGLRRDTAPSRQAREGVAGGVEIGPSGGRLTDLNPTLDTRAKDGPIRNQLAGPVITMAHGQGGAEIGFDRGPTLTCNHEAPIAAYGIRTANTSSNGWGIQEEATHTLDGAMGVAVAVSLRGREGGATAELGGGVGNCLRASGGGGDKAHVLAPVAFAQNSRDEVRLMGGDGGIVGALAAEPGMKQTCYIALPINTQIAMRHECLGESTGFGIGGESDPAYTITKGHSHAVAFHIDAQPDQMNFSEHTSATLTKSQHAGVSQQMRVRRLTPVECERLQGFPDNYTLVPNRGKPAANGPRYKALGNSWAVPVVRWIGERIAKELRGEL